MSKVDPKQTEPAIIAVLFDSIFDIRPVLLTYYNLGWNANFLDDFDSKHGQNVVLG